ncbi:unnamed protein product [Schistosoma margrebowiei]|uniref:Uncharacterized protein n=1 Tax=Schistosoma margrebowiei TaxID=48269 RepID=A0A3P8DUW7_9TREM|nr:unnamed protein product [Schistosoma margrebowiei]
MWFLSDICPNSNNTTDSSGVDNIGKLSENDKQCAPTNNDNNNNTLCSFDPLSISEDTDTLSDSKLDNLHCTTLYDVRRKISRHLNTIDTTTSAPETTSSDNSPAVTRRLILIGAKSSEAQTTESSDGGGGCGVIAERYKQLSSTLLDPVTINNNNNNNNKISLYGTDISEESKDYIQRSDNVRQVSTVDDNVTQSPFSSFSDDDGDDDEDDDDNECIPTEIVTKQSVNNNMGVSNENNNTNNSFRTNFVQSVPNNTYIHSGSNYESRNNSKFNFTSKISTFSLPIRNLSTATGPYRLRIGWHSHLKRPPPQPLSDSMAFHAFQLAETIRECAGGPSTSGSMFVAETEANDTVHRNLQLISFQLGLYGLGLFNRLLPSWQNRTFSRNGGWISQQVFEIGIPAACILYHSWQQHLTAAELTAISFQLSRTNNRSVRNMNYFSIFFLIKFSVLFK